MVAWKHDSHRNKIPKYMSLEVRYLVKIAIYLKMLRHNQGLMMRVTKNDILVVKISTIRESVGDAQGLALAQTH